jgi:hypothetical protein
MRRGRSRERGRRVINRVLPGSRVAQDANKALGWGMMRGPPRFEKERTPLLEMAP